MNRFTKDSQELNLPLPLEIGQLKPDFQGSTIESSRYFRIEIMQKIWNSGTRSHGLTMIKKLHEDLNISYENLIA